MPVHKVRHRGRVRWRARVTYGDATRSAYCDRKYQAQEAEQRILAEMKAKAEAGNGPPEPATFRDFMPRFLDHQAALNREAEMRTKRQVIDQHLLPAFGDLRLDQITTPLVDGYKAEKLRTLKPNTVANHITVIKRVLNQARDWNLIDRVPRIRQVKRPKTDFDYLTIEESKRYLAAAGPWRLFLLVAIRTGLRLGELRGLQWGDVTLDDNPRIRVARAFTKDGWGPPKSGHGRTVHLASDVTDALRAHKPARAPRAALVFPGPSGNPVDEKAAYNACKRVSKAAGLDRSITPHKLRHTFASHHAMRGTPLGAIQEWLGHADVTTTMRYAHLSPSTKATYANNVVPSTGLRLVEGQAPTTTDGTQPGYKPGYSPEPAAEIG